MNKIIEKKGEASVKLSASFFLLCQPKLFEKELKELEETIRNCRQKKEKKCSCKQPTSPCPILDIAKKMRRLKGKRN